MIKDFLSSQKPRKETFLVVILSFLIGFWFLAATRDMLYWPTDTEVYYLEAARALPQIKYISQMHQNFDQAYFRFLHGKEFYILTASWVQRLMGDTETLRPFLLICIFSITVSGILIFLIFRRLWGRVAGWFCYLFFVMCFWPYQQILYTGHLPQGLLLFLLAVASMLFFPDRFSWAGYLMAGIWMGLSFYSSPVSALYLLFFLAVFIWSTSAPGHPPRLGGARPRQNFVLAGQRTRKFIWLKIALNFILGLGGFLSAFVYFNYPDVFGNFKKFLEFVDISSSHTHFFYNQPILIQWMAHPELPVRGGWPWVFKYFLLIMPVLFPVFLATMFYLVWHAWAREKRWMMRGLFLCMIFLAWSAPLLAEAKAVAQIGRSYFPSLIGMLTLIGFGIFILQREYWPRLLPKARKTFLALAIILVVVHAAWNAFIFFTDVYPGRMGVTWLARDIKRRNIKEIYTYPRHPHRPGTVDCFPPDLLKELHFIRIDSIAQPLSGTILIPPVSGNSIYLAAHSSFDDFDQDLFLNELFRKGNISEYAVASYPTLVSSRIWPLEEEILAYKNLILNHRMDDRAKTRAWLLDAAKVHQDLQRNMPSLEEIQLTEKGIRDIGTGRPLHRFQGIMRVLREGQTLTTIPLKIFKVGNPTDGLVAYLYRVSPEEKLWIPVDADFASRPVAGSEITSSPDGQIVSFVFAHPKSLPPGRYRIVVYRTGTSDDKNFYRIYLNSEPKIP